LYAIFQVNLLIFPESNYIKGLLLGLACMSILIGVIGAISQTNIRKILGFHIISQVGYILLAGIFILSTDQKLQVIGFAAALFYMVHHILVKANLYLVSGLIRYMTGHENLTKISGLITHHRLVAFLFAVPALSLAGIPPFSGFWAKLGLFQASLSANAFAAVCVMIIGGFLTVFSMSKIWLGAFWGETQNVQTKPAPLCSLCACFLLTTLTIVIGFYPDLLFRYSEIAARSLLTGGVYGGY
jgi:multicomponent Na+:H+ antiporter subunit D